MTAIKRGSDGAQYALEVHVFPEASRGSGEGHRDWDLEPGSTMTNANVDAIVELNNGSILTEGGAILQYIADQQPGSGLASKAGTMECYCQQEWLTFIGTEIHKIFSPIFNKAVAEEVKTNARNLLTKRLGYVETQLANKPYLMGDTLSVADAYLFTVVGWSNFTGFDLSPFRT